MLFELSGKGWWYHQAISLLAFRLRRLPGLPRYRIQDNLIRSDQDEDVPYSLIEKLQESGINAADLKKLKDRKAFSNTCSGKISVKSVDNAEGGS